MTTQSALLRSTPEAQGVPSSAVSSLISAAEAARLELHSLVMLRRGQVIAEGWWVPYGPDTMHLLYSLSKSFTATAAGLAVAEGLLNIDDPVLPFFPDEAPAQPHPFFQELRVSHLLSMATGHLDDALGRAVATDPQNWLRGFFTLPPEQAPGSVFAYNNGATFVLAAILQRVTGTRLLDYLRPRLLGPLGIDQAHWQQNPQGLDYGFSGLHLTTEAVARFGQLYLQRGVWEGRQLIPAAWVDEATRWHIATAPSAEPRPVDWSQGYGYQFWQCRHGAYRGDGAFGQFCVVMPEQDAVLAFTAATEDMQGVLELVWQHLLPVMQNAALPEDPTAQSALAEQLASLALPPIVGERETPLAETVLGRVQQLHTELEGFPELQTLELSETAEGWQLSLQEGAQTHHLLCGFGHWQHGTTRLGNPFPVRVCSSGGWTAPDTFSATICYLETPHRLSLSCTFGEWPRLELHWNVAPLNLTALGSPAAL